VKPQEQACHYYLEQRGYSDARSFRAAQLEDKSWLLWFDLPDGELLLHATWSWKTSEWIVSTVYFEVD
jgi:hypothetical protein